MWLARCYQCPHFYVNALITAVLCKSLVLPIMSSYFVREMWNWSNLLQHLHTHFTTFILQLQKFEPSVASNFCNFFKVVFRNGSPGFLEEILKPLLLLGIVFAFYTILYQDWALSRLELLRVPSMTGSVIFFHPGMLLLHWECPWDHFHTEKNKAIASQLLSRWYYVVASIPSILLQMGVDNVVSLLASAIHND